VRSRRVFVLQRGLWHPGDSVREELDGVAYADDGTLLAKATAKDVQGLKDALGVGTTAHHDAYRKHCGRFVRVIWVNSTRDARFLRTLRLIRAKATGANVEDVTVDLDESAADQHEWRKT
jgi:hypothetical protein